MILNNQRAIRAILVSLVVLFLTGCGKKSPEFKNTPASVPSPEEMRPTSDPNDAFK